MRRLRFVVGAVLVVLLGAATGEPGSRAPDPHTIGGLSLISQQVGTQLAIYTRGRDIGFWTGINVGPTTPGHHPGELSVSAEDWRRWLPMIAATGVDAIRVYTVQPPSFYQELRRYNVENPDRPIYLVHGIWVPEDDMYRTGDIFDPSVLARLESDIDEAVAVVHGFATVADRPGHASGVFDADVSPWVVAWAFGIEMDPNLVAAADARYPDRTYSGRYVSAVPGATATEVWLAEMLDRIATREAERGRSMPLTFSNWPTTDPLEHPSEPLPTEDLVGIDINHLVAEQDWPGGLFASYHAYPYYPDFQRYEPGIADFEFGGVVDPYAGYLTALRDHHAAAGLPTMVLEFGVPSALGSAHDGSLGRDQGGHDEGEAMRIDADLLRTQHDLGLAGGFVFEWTDEWFKRTWNTMDYEIPAERRPLWQNALTNEANFGLMAADPGADGRTRIVDGVADDWTAGDDRVLFEGEGAVRSVRATHDEAYLYLLIETSDPAIWERSGLAVGFDAAPGDAGGLPGRPGVGGSSDGAFVIDGDGVARAYVRASNDPNDLLMGRRLGFFDVDEEAILPGSGVWNEQRLIVNRPLTVPTTGVSHPAEFYELNPLHRGTTDPSNPAFDSLALWESSGTTIEIRIPWAMVGMADPSSLQALVVGQDGSLSTETVDTLGMVVVADGQTAVTDGYAWEPWEQVAWHLRPKQGLEAFEGAVAEVTGR